MRAHELDRLSDRAPSGEKRAVTPSDDRSSNRGYVLLLLHEHHAASHHVLAHRHADEVGAGCELGAAVALAIPDDRAGTGGCRVTAHQDAHLVACDIEKFDPHYGIPRQPVVDPRVPRWWG